MSQYTLHRVEDTVHRVEDTGYSTQNTDYRLQITVHRSQYTQNRIQDSVHRVEDTGYSTQNRIQDTVHRIQITVHRIQDTVHRVEDTVHSTQIQKLVTNKQTNRKQTDSGVYRVAPTTKNFISQKNELSCFKVGVPHPNRPLLLLVVKPLFEVSLFES
jgi:hypothetical protein